LWYHWHEKIFNTPLFRLVAFACFIILIFSCKKKETPPCVCTEDYNPVCAGGNQFPNPCAALCEGFEEDELTYLLTQEQINTGLLVEVDCSSD